MLNTLLGGLSSHSNHTILNEINIPETANNISINSYSNGLVAQYSEYKPSINLDNDQYLISLTGFLLWKVNKKAINSIEELEAFLHQYSNKGVKVLKQLTGQFCLVIIDKKNCSCLIANDIMATYPVYYSYTENNNFVFANKLSFLKTNSTTNLSLNPQAIYNYIYFHMIPGPETIYKNIFKLEPGQFIFFKDNQYATSYYLPPSFSETTEKNEDELASEIYTTLDKSVKYFIHNSITNGCFLSGGLDSSAVAGLLAKNTKNQAKTFSIGFPVKEYNEIEYARTASKVFNTTQFEYFIQPDDVTNVINKVVSAMDEPFGNSSVIPVYYCAKLAKENGVNHLLAGDGGDEIFAGNTRYAKQKVFEAYFKIPNFIRNVFIEPLSRKRLLTSNFIGRKLKSYVEQANIPLPERLETYNFLHLNKPEDVFTSDFLSSVVQDAPLNLINKTYQRPDNASSLNRMLFLDWKHTLADNDLRKVNMMCELAGVDVSYPMLSPEMIELSCNIPSRLKLTPHKLRYLYKKAMKGFLPESIINKSKHGFGLPFGIWTKTDKNLQKIAYDSIEALKAYNIFNESFLEETIKSHQEVHASFYGELIWILMILGLWLDEHSK